MKDMKGGERGERRRRAGEEEEGKKGSGGEKKNRKRENGKGGEIKGGGGKRERGEKEGRQGKRSFHLSAQILSHIHHTCAKCQTPHIKKVSWPD